MLAVAKVAAAHLPLQELCLMERSVSNYLLAKCCSLARIAIQRGVALVRRSTTSGRGQPDPSLEVDSITRILRPSCVCTRRPIHAELHSEPQACLLPTTISQVKPTLKESRKSSTTGLPEAHPTDDPRPDLPKTYCQNREFARRHLERLLEHSKSLKYCDG